MNKHYPYICICVKGIDFVISTMKPQYLAFERRTKNIHSAWLVLNSDVFCGNGINPIIRDIAIVPGRTQIVSSMASYRHHFKIGS